MSLVVLMEVKGSIENDYKLKRLSSLRPSSF